MKSKRLVGMIITDGELSTSSTILPSIMHAVAVSGRSVYRTLGKGLYHCGLTMASATLS